jgi:hypothetical protein|tara:strand:+ start:3788 stop:4294 length:507 start_codon:yes stop_codon:yes gene_type:complete
MNTNLHNRDLNYENIKNKPINISLFNNITGTHTFNLSEPIKDVVKVSLVNAYAYANMNSSNWEDKYAIILHIDELQKNFGDNSSNNKLNNSFAILDNFKKITTNIDRLLFKNEYKYNQDITYFDPPINSINKLTCSIYDSENATSVSTLPIQLKLEFIIETKEKMRVY